MNSVPLEVVRYDVQTGLVPVIVQDKESNAVLMQAYANREALKRTMATGEAWFWSRSRQSFWHKGETSGNRQLVREIRVDCDGDSVLYLVDALGPACHTGEATCFFRTVSGNSSDGPKGDGIVQAKEGPDVEVSSASQSTTPTLNRAVPTEPLASTPFNPEFLSTLWDVVESRYHERPEGSYTTYLFGQGVDKAAKKVGEEAVEVVIAAKNASQEEGSKAELAAESADLLFHLLVLWKAAGLCPDSVLDVLKERHGG